jgi:hypothetical protein
MADRTPTWLPSNLIDEIIAPTRKVGRTAPPRRPGCGRRSRVKGNVPLPTRAFVAQQNSP